MAPSVPGNSVQTPGDGATPCVTFAITAFNAESTIERALRSASAQDWPDVDILVVDDASTDNTAEVVTAYATRDPRVRIAVQPVNQGVAAARNRALSEARGAYICFNDDDDESEPDRVAKQYARLVDYEASAGTNEVLCFTSRIIRRDGLPDGRAKAVGCRPDVPNGEVMLRHLMFGESAPGFTFGRLGAGTLFARVQMLQDVGGFDPLFRRRAEHDLAVRLARRGGHFVGIPEPLLIQHETVRDYKPTRVVLDYGKRLVENHADYLKSRRSFWRAWWLAHASYYGKRGNRPAALAYRALGKLGAVWAR